MEKTFSRGIVENYFKETERTMKLKGETFVYDNQKEKALEIFNSFMQGVSLVTLVASPQLGKTGCANMLMYMMTTHNDDNLAIHYQNVFIITGMSDKDWRQQTKERMLECFKERVYHRNDMHKLVTNIRDKRDILIIIDECHFGNESNQTIHECLKTAGLLDIKVLLEKNIKILCISATPGNVLVDAQTWGKEHHQLVIAKDNVGYTSFKNLVDEKRVIKLKDLKKENNVTDILDLIENTWTQPKYHIFRVSDSLLQKSPLVRLILERKYTRYIHNSDERIDNVEKMLATQPKNHSFIFVKGYWRAAKTLNDANIGFCYESGKDDNAIIQGLGGRLLGYGRQRGALAPILCCNVDTIDNYINWLNTNADYLTMPRYHTANMKIKDGRINMKKESTIHPINIENLTEQEIQPKVTKLCDEIKKVKVVCEVPPNAQIATKLDTYSVEQFKEVFGLQEFSTETDKLRALMLKANHSVNISLRNNSASAVSNLVNYYKKPQWAQSEYHIIKLDDDENITVITRKHSVLQNLKHGEFVVAHNSKAEMVLYRKV